MIPEPATNSPAFEPLVPQVVHPATPPYVQVGATTLPLASVCVILPVRSVYGGPQAATEVTVGCGLPVFCVTVPVTCPAVGVRAVPPVLMFPSMIAPVLSVTSLAADTFVFWTMSPLTMTELWMVMEPLDPMSPFFMAVAAL